METFWDNKWLTQGQEATNKKKEEDWYDIYKERRKMRGKEIKQVVKAVNIKKSPSTSSSSTLSTISLSTAKSSVDSRAGGKKKNDNNIDDGEGGTSCAAADACMRASLAVRHFIEYFFC